MLPFHSSRCSKSKPLAANYYSIPLVLEALLSKNGVYIRREFAAAQHLEKSWRDRCRVFFSADQPKIKHSKNISTCLSNGICICTGQERQDSFSFREKFRAHLRANFAVSKKSLAEQLHRRRVLDDQLIVLRFSGYEPGSPDSPDMQPHVSHFIHVGYVNRQVYHIAGMELFPLPESRQPQQDVIQLAVSTPEDAGSQHGIFTDLEFSNFDLIWLPNGRWTCSWFLWKMKIGM